jgi:hypothetical protein
MAMPNSEPIQKLRREIAELRRWVSLGSIAPEWPQSSNVISLVGGICSRAPRWRLSPALAFGADTALVVHIAARRTQSNEAAVDNAYPPVIPYYTGD